MKEAKRIRRMVLDVLDDCKKTSPEEMRAQLLAAGWKEESRHVWIDPEGKPSLGPYCAWKKMSAQMRREIVQ